MTERKVVVTNTPKPADLLEKQLTTAHLPMSREPVSSPSNSTPPQSQTPAKK